MKNLIFPYNCIEILLNDDKNQVKKDHLIPINDLFEKNLDGNILEESLNKLNTKELRKKLFYFLHDLFLDHIFLGNDLVYLTEFDIFWDSLKQKFFLKCIIFY